MRQWIPTSPFEELETSEHQISLDGFFYYFGGSGSLSCEKSPDFDNRAPKLSTSGKEFTKTK